MAKKLSELYAPKSKDEKAFVAKHTVKKTTDKSPSTKDDARFTGSNVKTFDRSAHRMGYNAGADEKAYDNGKNPGPNDMKDTTALAPYTVKEDEIEEGNKVNRMKRKAFDINTGRKSVDKQSNITAMKRLGRKIAREDTDDIELSQDDIDLMIDYLGELVLAEVDELAVIESNDKDAILAKYSKQRNFNGTPGVKVGGKRRTAADVTAEVQRDMGKPERTGADLLSKFRKKGK